MVTEKKETVNNKVKKLEERIDKLEEEQAQAPVPEAIDIINDDCGTCKEHGATINLGWEETYKDFTRTTAQYPKEVEMEYLMIGLANEVGEVLGKFKKHIRGDKMVVQDFNKALVSEMGDVMWYFARILDVLGVSFYEVMTNNISKLHSRMERDVIKGDGDDR